MSKPNTDANPSDYHHRGPDMGTVGLIGILILMIVNYAKREPKPVDRSPISIDKTQMDLAFHGRIFRSSAPLTNREWDCYMLKTSQPLDEEARDRMNMAVRRRLAIITDGTEILATGQIAGAFWDMSHVFFGYSVTFDTPETVQALEKRLGIVHPVSDPTP